ncbi:MAG: amino acid permease [Candidatus Woesearchaeota archaeon]
MGELQRTLSFPVMLIIGINSIMGTGVFFLQAIAAGVAGPASILSWLIMAVVAVGISMVFAELASMFDTAGGVYDYAKQVFGNFFSFLMGWLTTIVSNVTIAALVVGAIQYLNPALPLLYSISLSILFVLLFNYMAYKGMQTSSFMLVTFGVITTSSVVLLLIPGLAAFEPSNLQPFFALGALPVFVGVFLVADTFFGWQTITFLAEETKDARRVLPKVLLYSTYVIAVLCVLFALAVLASTSWLELSNSLAPLRVLSESLYGAWASPIFAILIYTSIIGSVAGWIVSSPRLLMALAKDKMFIPQLARIHPVNNTPHVAIAFQTVLTSALVIIAAGSYEALLRLSLPLVFVMYAVVIATMIRMRSRLPGRTRYYQVPGGVITAYCLLGVMAFFVLFWLFYDPTALTTALLAASLLLLGVPVYILLKYTYDPEAIAAFSARLLPVAVFFERVLLPKSIRKHVLSLVTVAEKSVLEFGSNAGTFTLHLAERIGPRGVLVATEFSESNAQLIQKRVRKAGHAHVQVLHDPHHLNRVHPSVGVVDVVVSIGYLDVVQDLSRVLKQLRGVVRMNGSVVFVEYIDYFWFLPNTGWSARVSELEGLFRENGFAVSVTKKKGFLWNYLIIHGVRSEDTSIPFI